jgi:hypothetical protein
VSRIQAVRHRVAVAACLPAALGVAATCGQTRMVKSGSISTASFLSASHTRSTCRLNRRLSAEVVMHGRCRLRCQRLAAYKMVAARCDFEHQCFPEPKKPNDIVKAKGGKLSCLPDIYVNDYSWLKRPLSCLLMTDSEFDNASRFLAETSTNTS